MTTRRNFNSCSQLAPQAIHLFHFFRRGLFLLLALILALAIFPLTGAAAEKNQDTIVELETEGEVQVKPDKATFHFTVVTEAAQAEEAAQVNAKEAENFLAAIKKVLGPEDKVKTLQYRVLPIFRKVEKVKGKEKVRTDEIAGYRAYHRFEVELRDLEKIGLVADTALKNGANEVHGPYFSHTEQEDLQIQAGVKALKRARQLAEALAQASDLKVQRVTKISTTHAIHPRAFGVAKAAPAALAERDVQTPIEIGDITFRARLTVTFALAP
jgi:uncharacterized protein